MVQPGPLTVNEAEIPRVKKLPLIGLWYLTRGIRKRKSMLNCCVFLNTMERVRNIVPRVLGPQVKGFDHAVVEILKPLWPIVVGRAMAEHSRPIMFLEDTLKIETHSTSWNLELHKMVDEIQRAINRFLGSRVVNRIIFEYQPNTDDNKKESVTVAKQSKKIRNLVPVPSQVGADLSPGLKETFRSSMSKYFSRFERKDDKWH